MRTSNEGVAEVTSSDSAGPQMLHSKFRGASSFHAAVLFNRVGPYHFARLRQTGRQLRITAVEFSGKDETYDWDPVAGADCFKRVTLFEQADSRTRPGREVRVRMQEVLDKLRPDVVAIPGWSDRGALSALKWCLARRVPAVVMSETTAWDYSRYIFREWAKRRVVRLCSGALVGGQAHADYLVQLGMPAERVFLGYDAIDNEYFIRKAEEVRRKEVEIRSRYGLPARYFLASARFVEKKNLPGVFRAYARYRFMCGESSRTPWHFVLLGDGELRGPLLSLRDELNLDGCVHLPGFKQYPELPIYYGLAQAFVHASTTEQWGLVVNEAMASGLPVLVSNRCGAAADLVRDGHNGFTFDPEDVEQLAYRMLCLNELAEEERLELGRNSQQLIADWGVESFAAGLQQAAELALRNPFPQSTVFDRALIHILIHTADVLTAAR